ncbi:MAG: response regulator [Chitinophagaceae bacterium]|nr:MAG: response regulator [Chitinophagaceae bacterium]
MILIVDDKKENLLSLQSLLTLHSYAVDTATGGEEALKKVLKNNYALVILDVQMPGMDGFEVAETISGHSKMQDVPIIFLSAVNTDKKFITRGYNSGAIDYIAKPIDPDVFLLKVNTLYKLYDQKRQLNQMQMSLRSEIEFRKHAQQESYEKAMELRFVLESIPQIAFTTKPNGVIEYHNSQWMEYSVYTDQFPETHPDDPDLQPEMKRIVAGNKTVQLEVRIKKTTGSEYRYHLLRIVPVVENKAIIKWVGTFTDIEEQKEASRKKDEFLSVASHELKTPLTSIKGYVQLLERSLEKENTNHLFIDRALTQVTKLDRLIVDLLDISRIENGKMLLNKAPFHFGKMLRSCVEMARQTYPNYQFIEEGHADVTVNGDIIRLEQVLINFLSNAVKYSPTVREIHVICRMLPGDRLLVQVKDSGIGIPKADQALIFDKFYRTDESTKNFQGLGLGLYICADILSRHQCEYGVESNEGTGSVFYFIIPFTNAPAGGN